MGKLTCKFVLHHRPRQDGTQQVRLRLTKDGATRFVDTALAVRSLREWNKDATERLANWLKSPFPDYKEKNEALLQDLLWVRELGGQHPDWTAEQFQARVLLGREYVEPDASPDESRELVAYFAADLRRAQAVLKPHSVQVWQAVYNKLRRFAGAEGLPFATLTPGRIKDFYAWLLRDPKCGVNQARLQMNFLRTVVTRAMDDGLLEYHKHPFRKLSFPKAERAERPRLNPEQMRLFLTAPLPITPKYPKANLPRMLLARHAWALQYLLAGARIGDVLELRWQNVRPTHVAFTERKTGKQKRVLLSEPLAGLLALFRREGAGPLDYVLPYLAVRGCRDWPLESVALLDAIKASVKQVNTGLRLLCNGIGLPTMTSHASRHTLIYHALLQSGDISLAQSLANHSSEAMTRHYTERESERQGLADKVMQALAAGFSAETSRGTKMEQDHSPEGWSNAHDEEE